MAFKPNRDKLNPKFEGYKLGGEPLACVSQSFKTAVRVARLKEEDFSYQHVRAFTLCNHLVADPWDSQSVYWCVSDGSVLKGSYTVRNLYLRGVRMLFYVHKLIKIFIQLHRRLLACRSAVCTIQPLLCKL